MNAVLTFNLNSSELIASHKDPKWWTGLLNQAVFDRYEKLAWMQKNWTLSFYASAIYILVIFGLKEWMKGCKAFNLKGPLILWNLSLAIFSIKGASVMISEMYKVLTTQGAHLSMCGTLELMSHDASYWLFLFAFSKIIELGDTLFIVLRKRPLIFLHWYHHISVFVVGWYIGGEIAAPGVWACVLNYSVHSIMYSYFTLTAMGIKISKKIAMTITSTQLAQFAVMLGIMTYTVYAKFFGGGCHVSKRIMILMVSVAMSYFILFGKFFVKAYVNKGKSGKVE